ncbi:hypothetical protein BKH43_04625 [Helicobacter sp. 13S00401-1]|uniref:hypothetical protein n=1 Tax=Helicobacter sp. 13S00401-1 TaxID=1905758 RepID=UPI000BA6C02E|nr:hypothetical protein [Helicobacter sp. 13S00401-1]PAF50380.1 hypothetical protein BKH43_04625 [Helicobacter sp. 13S00401-1]
MLWIILAVIIALPIISLFIPVFVLFCKQVRRQHKIYKSQNEQYMSEIKKNNEVKQESIEYRKRLRQETQEYKIQLKKKMENSPNNSTLYSIMAACVLWCILCAIGAIVSLMFFNNFWTVYLSLSSVVLLVIAVLLNKKIKKKSCNKSQLEVGILPSNS